jgi:hypothetical protein
MRLLAVERRVGLALPWAKVAMMGRCGNLHCWVVGVTLQPPGFWTAPLPCLT